MSNVNVSATAKAPKAPKAPKVKKVDPAREAKRAKRLAGLKELQKTDAMKFAHKVGFREAKQLINEIANPPAGTTSWATYCDFKAKAAAEYWNTMKTSKGQKSAKSIEKKQSRLAKLKAAIAALEQEIGGDATAPAKA